MTVVTIDGPAGAGKSTVARRLADRLGWRLLDTGAMYRAVALAAIRAGISLDDDDATGRLAIRLSVRMPPGQVLLDGEDVSGLIRTSEVSEASSRLAVCPSVRRRLVELQREFATENDVVAEGRDQGTVVFPDALRKYFLTASIEERARRRYQETGLDHGAMGLEQVIAAVRERDERDSTRAVAALVPAPDAVIVDTTGLTIESIVDRLAGEIHERLETTGQGAQK